MASTESGRIRITDTEGIFGPSFAEVIAFHFCPYSLTFGLDKVGNVRSCCLLASSRAFEPKPHDFQHRVIKESDP